MTTQMERTTFSTSRLLEFFTVKELQMQIGHGKEWWPVALTKELIDNALDAGETAGVSPEIEVSVEPDAVSVQDNGPGLPEETLTRSLDYLVRVSDKSHYVSPTRGQLGNALKCVWAAPYVAGGEHGRIDVISGGEKHQIDVALDRIAQRPALTHAVSPDGVVKTGTLVKMHWPGVASYLDGSSANFYNPPLLDVLSLLGWYAAFNPHATFRLRDPDDRQARFIRTAAEWRKWMPGDPTSPHWYNEEALRGLIAAYVGHEREGGGALTVREFVSKFRGLSGSQKQKAVTDTAGLSGLHLHDLVESGDIDAEAVRRLLIAMQRESRPVRADVLGILGEKHLNCYLRNHRDVVPSSVQYKKISAETAGGLPFVLEVAFGIRKSDDERRETIVGLNWSPTLKMPCAELPAFLGEARVDSWDPVTLVLHIACPRFEYTDRGKGILQLPIAMRDALEKAVGTVTRQWKQAKRKAARDDRMRRRDLEELRKGKKRRELSIKEAAYQVMEQAYLHASDGGKLPANARQIMYAARPLVLELTGGRCWKNSSGFTQGLLPDFIDANPRLTAGWDVVYDARGHLREPHTRELISLGTLEVRQYLRGWTGEIAVSQESFEFAHRIATRGPVNRYRHVLFIEKEGFNPLLESVELAERYDVAIMSTKGMSVTAARHLVEVLSRKDVTIFVIRDFDKSGFSIVHKLKSDTRRYRFSRTPNVVDLGLRLADVQQMDLQSEYVEYPGKKDPRENLRECGATEAECNFLVLGRGGGRWSGRRVELNAMTSKQLVAWLEHKLKDAGVHKVIPGDEVLKQAYKRAQLLIAVKRAADEALRKYQADEASAPPDDLQRRVEDALSGKALSWDEAVWDLCASDDGQHITP